MVTVQKEQLRESKEQQNNSITLTLKKTKYTNKELSAIAREALTANEINRMGRLEQTGRAEAAEEFIDVLVDIIDDKDKIIQSLQSAEEIDREIEKKLSMTTDNDDSKRLDNGLIKNNKSKYFDILMTRDKYSRLFNK